MDLCLHTKKKMTKIGNWENYARDILWRMTLLMSVKMVGSFVTTMAVSLSKFKV